MKRETSWKSGQSGNPFGAPKKEETWRSIITNELDRIEVLPDGNITAKELIARTLVTAAINGDIRAIKEIGDRIDGRPTQAQEIKTDTIDTNLQVIFIKPLN